MVRVGYSQYCTLALSLSTAKQGETDGRGSALPWSAGYGTRCSTAQGARMRILEMWLICLTRSIRSTSHCSRGCWICSGGGINGLEGCVVLCAWCEGGGASEGGAPGNTVRILVVKELTIAVCKIYRIYNQYILPQDGATRLLTNRCVAISIDPVCCPASIT